MGVSQSKMNIPTDIITRINPDIDPISKSVIYTFTNGSYTYDNDGDMIFKFPYSRDTFWTHFKFNSSYNLAIEIILVTGDGYTYTVSSQQMRERGIWYDTTWPIPSIKTMEDSGVYLKIKPHNTPDFNLSIKLCGFMDLFPKVENYLLLSSLDTYQFVFAKYELDDLDPRGLIYNVENYHYIREIIIKACGVRLISRY